MARRGENIRKRTDNRWEGRYKFCLKEDGTWKYRSVYGRTYTEVKEKLIIQRSQQSIPFANAPKYNTFSEILLLWLQTIRVEIKASTENKYQYMIEKHISPVLGKYRISDLNAALINAFLDSKLKAGKLNGKGGLAPSYVQTMSVIIGSALQFAVQEELCAPLKSPIRKPTLVKQKLNILSKEHQKQLESVLFSNTDEVKLGILLALMTGMRLGEICALEWSDIDFDNAIIHVNHTVTRIKCDNGKNTKLVIGTPKTKSSLRDIPIPFTLIHILRKMSVVAKSKFVVSTKTTFVSTRSFDYRYKKVLRNADIPEMNFHCLRHTFATRCVNAGVDVKTLSEILGHANVGITLNVYVHPSLEMKKEQLNKLYAVG